MTTTIPFTAALDAITRLDEGVSQPGDTTLTDAFDALCQREWLSQQAVCPTCNGLVGGLLAVCGKPECRAEEIAYDAAMDARCDI